MLPGTAFQDDENSSRPSKQKAAGMRASQNKTAKLIRGSESPIQEEDSSDECGTSDDVSEPGMKTDLANPASFAQAMLDVSEDPTPASLTESESGMYASHRKSMSRLKANLKEKISKMVDGGGYDAYNVQEDDFLAIESAIDDEPMALQDNSRARRPRSPQRITGDIHVMHRALCSPPMTPAMMSKKAKGKNKVNFKSAKEVQRCNPAVHFSSVQGEDNTSGQNKSTSPKGVGRTPGAMGSVHVQIPIAEECDQNTRTFGNGRSFRNFVRCRIMAVASFLHRGSSDASHHQTAANRLNQSLHESYGFWPSASSRLSTTSVRSSINQGQRTSVNSWTTMTNPNTIFGRQASEPLETRKAVNTWNARRGTTRTGWQSSPLSSQDRRRSTLVGKGLSVGHFQKRVTQGRRSTFAKRMTSQQYETQKLDEIKEDDDEEKEKDHPVYDLIGLSRNLNMPLDEVQRIKDVFESFDTDKSGDVSSEEFEQIMLRLAQTDSDESLPQELLKIHWREVDTDGSGDITFPEFARWYSANGFHEEMLLPQTERMIRQVARKHGLPLMEVERIKKQFDVYDEDHSGEIEKDEFEMLLYRLLKVPRTEELPASRVRQFWQEIDQDRSGCVDFEEFLCWYTRYFNLDGSTAVSPIEEFYKSIRFPRSPRRR